MSGIWDTFSNGGQARARTPMSVHRSDDFDDVAPGQTYIPGMRDDSGHGEISPNMSVSKFDGRPFLGPGSPGGGGSPMGRRGATPPSPHSPFDVHTPQHFDAMAAQQSVSLFDGRPIGQHVAGAGGGSPGGAGGRSPTPGVAVLAPGAVMVGGPGGMMVGPGAGSPGFAQHHNQHLSPHNMQPHLGRDHGEVDMKTDCIGGGNALMKRIRALFTGQPVNTANAGVCFYDDRQDATVVEEKVSWQYHGRAGYEEVQQYNFQGQGMGMAPHQDMRGPIIDPHHLVHQEPHWRLRPCAMALLFCLIVIGAVTALFAVVSLAVKMRQPSFECDADAKDQMTGWSFEKKAWCCQNEQKGCLMSSNPFARLGVTPEELQLAVTMTTTSTVTTAPFECDVDHMHEWTPGQGAWCCLKMGRGCPVTTTLMPFDCEFQLESWSSTWSADKKGWCCLHQRVGCSMVQAWPLVLPRKPIGMGFNCSAGFFNWQAGWSIGKKSWCCEFENKACPYTTTTIWGQHASEPYDCEAGYNTLQMGWSMGKKEWCCLHHQKGCAPGVPLLQSSCDTLCTLNREDSSCKNRVGWLVKHLKTSCAESLTRVIEECDVCGGCSLAGSGCQEPFDCRGDISNAQVWAQDKKDFCCRTVHDSEAVGVICVGTTQPPPTEMPYDCRQDFQSWLTTWSVPKKFWCCAKEGKGCETYNCDSGNPADWLLSQKFWCCKSATKGCEALPFDCDAGYTNWNSAWSPDKKAWCCDNADKGCAQDDHNCNSGLAVAWGLQKQMFCCSTAQKACEYLPYDCNAGFDRWNIGWADEQKEWCCDNADRGCPPDEHQCGDDVPEHWDLSKQMYCCDHESKGCDQLPYDCAAGLDKWKVGWSGEKQVWCCAHRERACPMDQHDCHSGDPRDWDVKKQIYCCDNDQQGCDQLPYDCNVGLDSWKIGWSEEKKDWCCANREKGCPENEHDCSFEAPRDWDLEKQIYCCEHEEKGCDRLPYDCSAGFDRWQVGWADEKKEWCCGRQDKGCPDHEHDCNHATPDTWDLDKQLLCCESAKKGCDQLPFDCDDGYDNWKVAWAYEKKNWCCDHRHKGCLDDEHDCDVDAPDSWRLKKQLYCCDVADQGCDQLPFDCAAGYESWKVGWSEDKKEWCCDHRDKGCPDDEHNCNVGNTQQWDVDKQIYCCDTAEKGCELLRYDCEAGYDNWKFGWSNDKKDWCCLYRDKGCPTKEHNCNFDTPEHWDLDKQLYCCSANAQGCDKLPFDCNAGFESWKVGWAVEKKDWCCKHKDRACPEPTLLPEIEKAKDCNFGDPGTWNVPKMLYCCDTAQKSCEMLPFDCNAGFDSWQLGWSIDKKEWCCDNRDKGCPDHEHECGYEHPENWDLDKQMYCCAHAQRGCTFLPFDCNAGYNSWKLDWSDGKKSWCCAHRDMGCVEHEHDCTFGPPEIWDVDKNIYCCEVKNKGCDHLPFDCSAGFEAWTTGWDNAKKSWCCEHNDRGCPPHPLGYDCNLGAPQMWDLHKQLFCCDTAQKGCALLPFDCKAGWQACALGWMDDKKQWCAQHTEQKCSFQATP